LHRDRKLSGVLAVLWNLLVSRLKDTRVKHLKPMQLQLKVKMKLESRLHNQSNTSRAWSRSVENCFSIWKKVQSAKALEKRSSRMLVPKRTFYTECQCRYSCSNCKTKSNYWCTSWSWKTRELAKGSWCHLCKKLKQRSIWNLNQQTEGYHWSS
jgi:hypothetical protein